MNPTCIYCRQTKALDEFDSDHVIPECFGTFGPNTWTLNGCVCKNCNGRFGRKLELFFGRDSLEGILRAEALDARAGPEERDFVLRRLQLRVPDDPEYGRFAGLRAAFDWKRGVIVPLAQITWIDQDSTERRCASEFDLDQMISAGMKVAALPGSACVFGKAQEAERLADKAAQLGIASAPRNAWRELETPAALRSPGKALFEISGTVDETIRRAIAKIALNYVAYVKGAAYVLNEGFDDIRSYIVTGEPKGLVGGRALSVSLFPDTPADQRTVAHVVTAETVPRSTIIRGHVRGEYTGRCILRLLAGKLVLEDTHGECGRLLTGSD